MPRSSELPFGSAPELTRFKSDLAGHDGLFTQFVNILDRIAQWEQPGDEAFWPAMADPWILSLLQARDLRDCPLPLSALFGLTAHLNQALTVRVIQNAITRIEIRERLSPPLPFCWISMGSDARGEQVIRTDQDNALIYADPMPNQAAAAQAYFSVLAQEVTRQLHQFGFALCQGDVMASNPDWCRPVGSWHAALDEWVGSSDPQAVRKLTILLDFRPVFGDQMLAAMLQTRVFSLFAAHPQVSHYLARDDQLFAAPKTGFGRIRTRKKQGCRSAFNLKTQALAHIVNGARLFAVNNGIRHPATLKRLAQMASDQVLPQDSCRELIHAFTFLTRLKLTSHLGRGPFDLAPNFINVKALDPLTRKALHQALDRVTWFQKQMAGAFNQAWMNFFN